MNWTSKVATRLMARGERVYQRYLVAVKQGGLHCPRALVLFDEYERYGAALRYCLTRYDR